MKCEYCERIGQEVLYEDSIAVIALRDNVLTAGQITVYPKKHSPILETIDEKTFQHCFQLASKVSIAAFESLGSQGTNILIQNGLASGQTTPHFAIEVIPRIPSDNLSLKWNPTNPTQDGLAMTLSQIIPEMDKPVVEIGDEVVVDGGDTEAVLEQQDENNFLLKSLKRLP